MALKVLKYNASLVSRIDITEQLAKFTISYDEALSKTPPFIGGQYVALGLNNEVSTELGSVRRSMSISSAPQNGKELEFYIRYVTRPESDNPLTHLLWKMRPGDRLFATRKPVGKFTVGDTLGQSGRLCVFVAAGTGLAPFVSMIREVVVDDKSADLSKIVLLHGASYPADLGYKDELSALVESNGLHYRSTVSRPKETSGWTGDTGRVEDYFFPERLSELEASIGIEPITPKNAGVLICGLQGTISGCIERLAKRGFVPFDRKIRRALDLETDYASSMWWEQYDTEPVIDLDNVEALATIRQKIVDADLR